MKEQDFIPQQLDTSKVEKGSFTWKAPSNIALVKYWGKKENQIPENTSISFTLNNCHTITKLYFVRHTELDTERIVPVGRQGRSVVSASHSNAIDFDIYFEGEKKEDFKPKIASFFKRIKTYCQYLKDYKFTIESKNSFPHSSGIASSASGMGALALCVMSLEKELWDAELISPVGRQRRIEMGSLSGVEMTDEYFYKKASFLARLGSGSACRSIKGEIVVWGAHKEIEGSSKLFGVPYIDEIHDNFKNYQDTILLVDKGEKHVSSTLGHSLMHGHPFAQERFRQAEENISKMKSILKLGNLEAFVSLVESEALTLHSMMMTSNPYFILMKPNTLKIIHKIWGYRAATNSNMCFTLDAGANVHLLFPAIEKEAVSKFVEKELAQFCQNNQYICDEIGEGSEPI